MSKIKKLFYSSLVAFIGIGINFDIEARVTKEVAEATLPYLMEAAGIPGDPDEEGVVSAKEAKYKNVKIKAILDMIYTDEGQQQMVNWAVRNTIPNNLAVFGEPFSNGESWSASSSNQDATDKDSLGEKCFQKLFPCKTGTFTSFANHTSRFGYIVLTKYESVKDKLLQWIKDGRKPVGKNDIIAVGNEALDCKIARIIFILDILDDLQQIKDICPAIPDIVLTVKSEYTCRPVSATIAYKEGDCVETLYRHLINIAIQDPTNCSFHIERLPWLLQRYFSPFQKKEPIFVENVSCAGTTSIIEHNKWKNALQSVSDFKTYFNISSGAIYNIARVLWQIAFFETTEEMKPFGSLENFEKIIEISMNKLACSFERFSVIISEKQPTQPSWTTHSIIIKDKDKTITIGVCEDIANNNFGHAEITTISTEP